MGRGQANPLYGVDKQTRNLKRHDSRFAEAKQATEERKKSREARKELPTETQWTELRSGGPIGEKIAAHYGLGQEEVQAFFARSKHSYADFLQWLYPSGIKVCLEERLTCGPFTQRPEVGMSGVLVGWDDRFPIAKVRWENGFLVPVNVGPATFTLLVEDPGARGS